MLTEDIIGATFGRLTVIGRAEPYVWRHQSHPQVVCRCSCGKEIIARIGSLRSGNTRSCGCSKIEACVIARAAMARKRKQVQSMATKNDAGRIQRRRDRTLVSLMERAKQRPAPVAEGFTRDAVRTDTGK